MNTTATKSEIKITARAKAFSGYPVGTYKFLVTEDDVMVWDSVAGAYTRCNCLSAGAKRRIRKLATQPIQYS